MKKKILGWLGVDLERYENLKSENKKLKNKCAEIEKELNMQIAEMKLPCKVISENINNDFPKGNELKDITDAYNRSANTERLIYGQKLQFIKNILNPSQ